MSLLGQAAAIYRKEGYKALIEKITSYIKKQIYIWFVSVRGTQTIRVGENQIVVLTPTKRMVARNLSRVNSEKEEIGEFIEEIRSEDIVYDIGANTGLYSLFAANQCTKGAVIAFEPYPPNSTILKDNVDQNNISNIEILEIALSDSNGEIEFQQPVKDDVGYGSAAITPQESTDSIKIPTTTGDQLVSKRGIPYPNVVKIDVEGAESLVINGLEECLSSTACRLVFCEVHLPGNDHRPSIEDFGSTQKQIVNQLERLGFSVEQLGSERESEIFYKAYK